MANAKSTTKQSKATHRLSPAGVKAARDVGAMHDGSGLYLVIRHRSGDATQPPSKSWVLRYKLQGKEHAFGIGPYPAVGLSLAREKAAEAQTIIKQGRDPVEEREAARKAEQAAAAQAKADAMTFRQCAVAYIKAHRAGWRNAVHAAQWEASLEAYAFPTIGDLPVAQIDTGHVTKILQPIWHEKTETASRVRSRIECILSYGGTMGWRDENAANPARWKGHLANVLPKRSKVAKVEHHSALPWQQVGGFMAELRKLTSGAAIALQFAVLTATRANEVIGATWEEIDLKARTWTIPAERMKAGREHRVPLSDAVIAVLNALPSREGHLFSYRGRRLSNMAMLSVLRRMGRGDVTVHGFRSTFRSWAAEATSHADAVAEAALAHSVGNAVVAAYQRGDLFEKRCKLMDDWSAFCAKPFTDNVVALRAAS